MFRDYGDWPGANKLFEAYLQQQELEGIDGDEALEESASTSDFGNYLADKANKRLLWGYGEVRPNWRRYSRTFNVPDYKPITFVRLTEMQGLLEVAEGGEYLDSELGEITGPAISVKKFGRLFSITREAIINDDLNQLRDRPAAMGRAAARTLNNSIVNTFEANPNTSDGVALFHTSHANLLSGSQYALNEQPLADAMTLMRQQTGPEGWQIGMEPRLLLIPLQLEMTARRILNSTLVPMAGYPRGDVAGATPPAFGMGGTNVLAGAVEYVIERFLKDPSDWYVVGDLNEAPLMGVAFLNGREQPDIMLRDPGMRLVLGGSDPYSMRFDEIIWKIRHEWGVSALDHRGAVKVVVP